MVGASAKIDRNTKYHTHEANAFDGIQISEFSATISCEEMKKEIYLIEANNMNFEYPFNIDKNRSAVKSMRKRVKEKKNEFDFILRDDFFLAQFGGIPFSFLFCFGGWH